MSGTLTVGDAGSGQVVRDGGTEITASNIVIGGRGAVNSNGGILDPLTIQNRDTLGGSGNAVGAIDNSGKVYAVGAPTKSRAASLARAARWNSTTTARCASTPGRAPARPWCSPTPPGGR